MRILNFVIFLSVFFTLYGLVNFYIYLRGSQALSAYPTLKKFYPFLFLIVSLSFIVGRFLERASVCVLSDLFIWVGSLWFAFMLYLFLSIVFFDLIRLANHYIPFYPQWIKTHYDRFKLYLAIGTLCVSGIIIIIGFINAKTPRINKLQISIPKKAGSITSLRIALATDIHLGTIISNSRLQKLVDTINQAKPDIVLLAGDIVDEDLKPVIVNNLGNQLKTIKSTYGTYAITGNHEYIGGVEPACTYLKQHGISVIRDTYKLIAGSFYIIGREDRSINRFINSDRRPLADIIQPVDARLPLILLDHQPFNLNEAVDNGIDLQLSGHTHAGQLWPFTYLVNAIYTLGYGYKIINNTHFYVSSGFGTWGPPVRLGNSPEIVFITLNFQ